MNFKQNIYRVFLVFNNRGFVGRNKVCTGTINKNGTVAIQYFHSNKITNSLPKYLILSNLTTSLAIYSNVRTPT